MAKARGTKRTKIYDTAVIGADVSALSSAIQLARGGQKVILFSHHVAKEKKPSSEFIGPEAFRLLSELGLKIHTQSPSEISRIRLHGPRQSCEVSLPFPAYGVSTARLELALLRAAKKAGVEMNSAVLVGFHDEFNTDLECFSLATAEGAISARRLIYAGGLQDKKSSQVGLQIHLRLKPSEMNVLNEHCDIFVFEGGYGVLVPIEDGLANFCCYLDHDLIESIGTDWLTIASHIAYNCMRASRFLESAEPLMTMPIFAQNSPVGYLRRGIGGVGTYYVGDQMAAVSSLLGDELTIDLITAREASTVILDQSRALNERAKSRYYYKVMRARLRSRVLLASQLHHILSQPQLIDLSTHVIQKIPWLAERLLRTAKLPSAPRIESLPPRNRQIPTNVES